MGKRKTSLADKIFTICNALFMIAFVIITLYPVLNTLAISFNDGIDAVRGGIYLWPRKFSLKNYTTVLSKQNMITGAYKRFIFKSELSLFWVITMYVNGGLIPVFLLYRNLQLTGTFWVYIIPGTISAFNMLVLRTYMLGLPDSLEESAQLDGAGYWTVFIKIISPLCRCCRPAIASSNSWFDAMLYNRMKTEYATLQYELMKLLSSVMQQSGSAANASAAGAAGSTITPVTVRSAATIATMLPIVCLYPFLQRYFVAGLTIGGVKE